MKKFFYKSLASLSIIILIILFYLNSNYFIRKQEWKYGGGGYIGDWINFNYIAVSVKGRTIYINEMATGKIIICIGKKLIIKELKTGEICYYINKSNFLNF